MPLDLVTVEREPMMTRIGEGAWWEVRSKRMEGAGGVCGDDD